MKLNTALLVAVSLLVGFVIGMFFSTPRPVKAYGGPLYVTQVHDGLNSDPILSGKTIVGFSCSGDTSPSCYVAAQ